MCGATFNPDSLDYTGRIPNRLNNPKTVTVDSRSWPGVQYQVDLVDDKGVKCDCPGFSYRGKCAHLEIAEQS